MQAGREGTDPHRIPNPMMMIMMMIYNTNITIFTIGDTPIRNDERPAEGLGVQVQNAKIEVWELADHEQSRGRGFAARERGV